VELCLTIAREPGLSFRGLMTHEGHVGRAGDPEDIRRVGLEAGRLVVGVAEAVRRAGLEVPVVSVGSTTAATITPTVPGVTEMRPGIYAFYDATRVAQDVVPLSRVAATILSTVVGRPSPERLVLDAGSKALSMDPLGVRPSRPGFGVVVDRPEWLLERLSEEHGVARVPPDVPVDIGELVRVVPNHVCSAVNLFEEIIVVRGPTVVERWPIAARGRSH
jgi:D-serine deaminase-like pyridoxal phosphate-dependent protein